MNWTLGFIGAGVMAEVMIAGILDEGVLDPSQVVASDRRSQRTDELSAQYGIRTTLDNKEVAAAADVLVLAVKPQTLAPILRELKGQIPAETTVLSIVAGARMDALRRGLAHDKVVRTMPNLPCRIRQGMTVWAAPEDASSADLERIKSILCVMGAELQVHDESHVDRATAVNGTGPAIVAAFVKAMLEAATYIGEPRSVAHETVLATLMGTAQMIRQSSQDGVHVAELIDEVTSPGGTTSRALQILKQGRFSACLTEAIDAAHQRTVKLGEALETSLQEESS